MADGEISSDADSDEEESKESGDECNEYIFLIDRSGSMYNTI